jgi:hypothetical protein
VSDLREAAWEAVHEALPARWQVEPATYDPGRSLWLVTARGPHPGRGKTPTTVTGAGADEMAALRDLDGPGSRLAGRRSGSMWRVSWPVRRSPRSRSRWHQ